MITDVSLSQPVTNYYQVNTLSPQENGSDQNNLNPRQNETTETQENSTIQISAEARLLMELKKIDREVKNHEQAHKAAGGDLIMGAANYSYKTGPDGKFYAVAGEVQIDTSPVPNDPEATARKAERIIRAALAPAEPSSQDRQVAANARSMAATARSEALKEKYQTPELTAESKNYWDA